MNYYTIHAFSKMCGITPQTLRNWDKNGTLIPHHKTPSGYRYYSQEQLNFILNKSEPIPNRIVIGYCRVSSTKQKDDLQRQIDAVKTYLTSQGKPFEIIADIGSGINYNKPGLVELLRRINQNEVEKVVVLYKDRLLRFGFDLVKQIAMLHSTNIEVIDSTPKLPQQELVEDLVQIITVFGCKLQGQRANKAKKFVQELIVYRADRIGIKVVLVDRFYASSKTCSVCGHKQDMPLSKRVYVCPECGNKIDRDLNAAINLRNYGETH